MLVLILVVLALVLFLLVGFNVPSPRVSLLGFGLACLAAADLVQHWPGAFTP